MPEGDKYKEKNNKEGKENRECQVGDTFRWLEERGLTKKMAFEGSR